MNIQHTRAMVHAAIERKLEGVEFTVDPVFGLSVPASVPDVPTAVLQPRGTWADPAAYDDAARQIAAMFVENFRQFEDAPRAGGRRRRSAGRLTARHDRAVARRS